MNGYEIRFFIYANNEEEVADMRAAVVDFISAHAKCGRAVCAKKVADALRKWDSNAIVKNEIIKYFS